MTSLETAPPGAVSIPLTNGQFALVDEADADLVGRYRWHTTPWGYAVTKQVEGREGERVYMHRLLAGEPPGSVDHANRVRLDNRRANLRACTHQQNTCNAPKQIGRSGYRGVQAVGNAGLWRAMITSKGETLDLGCYEDAEKAAKVYDAAAKVFHGKFALTNGQLGLLP